MTCVCRAKVHHRGNQHPFVHTSHIFKNNFIYLDLFYLFFIYFLQYCVGFCCTTVLILFIFVFTGPSLQCMGVFLLRSTGSSGQASAAAARGLSSYSPWAQQLQLPGSRAQTQQLWCTGLVAPHVGSSQTRDQTCVSCIGRWTLIPLSQQGTPHPTFRFLYVVVCLLFVVVLLFVVHVHIPFRSLTS